MQAGDRKFNIIDSYLGLIRSISPENKVRLISRLSDSLREFGKNDDRSINDLYGAFVSEKSADEILCDLKASRNLKP